MAETTINKNADDIKPSTKMFLEVDASQIDVKQLLQKDFLELSMKAISSANPNVNNTWFTRESMERSLGSFVNKPILGYFENDDFVSHNGSWDHDTETQMDYWNTLGKKGERILGIIRESDEIKIVEDKQGLSWVVFTCALWTQYSFKQVKRLIKDAKRAKRNGGPTKNISVEVDLTDYEKMDNGVTKINAFNLVGVTILGTRNGIKVEPGIEGAELSVVDIMGRDVYSAQEKTLRLAYEKLNNSLVKKEESKVESEVVTKGNEAQAAFSADGPSVDTTVYAVDEAAGHDETDCGHNCGHNAQEDVCPDCGKAPCECEQHCKSEAGSADTVDTCEKQECSTECSRAESDDACDAPETSCKNASEDDDADNDGGDRSAEEGADDETEHECNAACDDGCGDAADADKPENYCGPCSDCCEQPAEPDPVSDLAWLMQNCHWGLREIDSTLGFYADVYDGEDKDYILGVLGRVRAKAAECQSELSNLIAVIAAGITEADREREQKLEQYANVEDLIASYERTLGEVTELQETVQSYAKQEFLRNAYAMIDSSHIAESDAKTIRAACESGEIVDLDSLKIRVALSAFEAQRAAECASEGAAVFSAPVVSPNTVAAFSDKDLAGTKGGRKSFDHWANLHDYVGKQE